MCDEGLHDPFTDQVECARFKAERDALAQRMEEIASEIDRTLSGVEGIEDAPAMRWMRGLREALGSLHAPRIGCEDIEAAKWVREYGGLAEVKRKVAASMDQADDYIALRCSLAERAGDLYEMLDKSDDELIAMLDGRLMPPGMEWPRFEDSSLVEIGDEYECWCGDTEVVRSVTLRDGRSVLNQYQSHSFVVSDWPFTAHGKRVKRPAHKVLDADGVEIHEKCDAWWICEGDERGVHAERLRVETIGPDGLIECSPYNGGTWVYLEPSELYVNKPVPASDGKPLREGETVWHVKTGREYVVVEPSYGKTVVVRLAKYDDAEGEQHAPDHLTHERPEIDSWERLEEDAGRNPFDYCKEVGHRLDTCENSEAYKALDIVRRAKALAGVSER